MDSALYKILNEWAKRANDEVKEPEWIEIPNLGKFKNLKIKSNQQEEGEIIINMKYDEWKKIKDNG